MLSTMYLIVVLFETPRFPVSLLFVLPCSPTLAFWFDGTTPALGPVNAKHRTTLLTVVLCVPALEIRTLFGPRLVKILPLDVRKNLVISRCPGLAKVFSVFEAPVNNLLHFASHSHVEASGASGQFLCFQTFCDHRRSACRAPWTKSLGRTCFVIVPPLLCGLNS